MSDWDGELGRKGKGWDMGERDTGTYDDPTSPRNAFSFATSGGLKLDCAFSKYCMAGMMALYGKYLSSISGMLRQDIGWDYLLQVDVRGEGESEAGLITQSEKRYLGYIPHLLLPRLRRFTRSYPLALSTLHSPSPSALRTAYPGTSLLHPARWACTVCLVLSPYTSLPAVALHSSCCTRR
jgi:hypothetical protein